MWSRENVRSFLRDHAVSVDQWNEENEGAFERLYAELVATEAVLCVKDEKVLRVISAVGISVYHVENFKTLVLREDRQVLKNGQTRVRALQRSSLGEKMKASETPITTARRALKEELGIDQPVELLARSIFEKPIILSESFPGIYTKNTLHLFDVFLPEHLYRSEGYVEAQEDKTTYFVWDKETEDE